MFQAEQVQLKKPGSMESLENDQSFFVAREESPLEADMKIGLSVQFKPRFRWKCT